MFLPSGEQIGRLVKRAKGHLSGYFEVTRRVAGRQKPLTIRLSLTNHTKQPATLSGAYKQWLEHSLESVYIPVKDMMANAPGFGRFIISAIFTLKKFTQTSLTGYFWGLCEAPQIQSGKNCWRFCSALWMARLLAKIKNSSSKTNRAS